MADQAILTINQKIDAVNNFINSVVDARNSYYCYIGKPDPWTDENNPPPADGSVTQIQQSIYQNMVYGKKLLSSDINFMITRYQWTSGTIYDRYDNNDSDLYSKVFFVINNTNDVYKCIHNGYSPSFPNGIPSTVNPTVTDTSGTFQTSDGYIWKYMFTCDSGAYTKFQTTNYVPVTINNNVVDNAVPGTIDNITIMNGGENYQVYEEGFLSSFVNNAVVVLPTTSNPNDDYYTGSSIYLKSGFGAGQISNIIKYVGSTKQLGVNPPFGYYHNLNFDPSRIYGGVNFAIGDFVTQLVSKLTYVYKSGNFNLGDTIYQSDTSAYGEILHSNSVTFDIQNESDVNNLFDLRYPIYSRNDSALIKTGKVSINVAANAYLIQSVSANIVANTLGVNVTANTIKLSSSNTIFNVGDRVYYKVPTGNTALGGLTGNTNYYITFSNSTDFAVSTTSGGTNVNITEARTTSPAQVHTFTGNVDFTSVYSLNQFIRVGDDQTVNTRRITQLLAPNTSTGSSIGVDVPYTSNVYSANNYLVPDAASLESIVSHYTQASIVYTNLTSLEINYGDITPLGLEFIVGETVSVVDINNLSQNSNGTVSFANSSFMIVSNMQNSGGFVSGLYMLGSSSTAKAQITGISSYPNITVEVDYGGFVVPQNDPLPYQFIQGSKVFVTKQDGTAVGNGYVLTTYSSPDDLTEYVISPAVNITGDGNGALAYCTVDLSENNPSRSITTIQLINNGQNYTKANVSITDNRGPSGPPSNPPYAVAIPQISPVNGHGFDPYTELGATYCGISKTFNNGAAESYLIPTYGSYRNVGIIKNPLYNDVILNATNFDRTTLVLHNAANPFTSGEIVLQPHTNAAGVVVSSNTSVLEIKNTVGSFIYNTAYDNIYGLSSTYTANVYSANTKYFQLPASLESVSDITQGGSGMLSQPYSPSGGMQQIRMTNVVGSFSAGDNIYEPVTNTYAVINATMGILTSNGTIDSTLNFGQKINQTVRISLSSNTKPFALYEYITQDISYATGRIISTSDELDIVYNTAPASSWVVGETIQSSTGATAVITYVDSVNKILKLTNVSNMSPFNETDNRPFNPTNTITNLNASKTSTINTVYSVILVDDVNYISGMQTTPYLGVFTISSEKTIRGDTTGAQGYATLQNSIRLPDLVRESGDVIYTRNLEKFTRSTISNEQVKLIIKF